MTTAETRQVFQMCLAAKDGREYGYLFPSEVEEANVSTIFAIPLKPGEDGRKLTEYTYEMPGLLGKDVYSYTLRYDGEVFLLEHEKLARPLRFSFFADPFDPLAQKEFPQVRSYPYLGTKKDVVSEFSFFVPIFPLDIGAMDKAYLEHRMALVGRTDAFPS